MFNTDAKTLQRVASRIPRVLVIDPNAHAARLLSDLVKQMGAKETAIASRTDKALVAAYEFDPQLIVTEFTGPALDGLELTRQLRRSGWSCRTAPVIMVTAEATKESILGARNAGVHEFLRKPYTAGDLYRRVENVILKPRPWIEAQSYVGPDRRRFNSGEFQGAKKRRTDAFKPAFADAAG